MTEPINFDFASSGRIIFGASAANSLPDRVSELGRRAFICTGAHPQRHAAIFEVLKLPAKTHPIVGEPTIEAVRNACRSAREFRTDVVIGIGGGSVIDAAKAVATLLASNNDPLDHLEIIGGGVPITHPSIPVIAVPTTAGTGAEVTANAVLTSPEHQTKASMRSKHMLPRYAIVDPNLTVGCPPAATAASGLDALTQCLEPFVSPAANPLTDALAAEGLHRAAAGLRRAYMDGTDIDARTDMSLCSLFGGLALANAKLGAVHGFAGVIGGRVLAQHGNICAKLLAPSTAINVRALRQRQPYSPALTRYRDVAHILTGRSAASIEDGISWIRETVQMLGIPSLSTMGVSPNDIVDLVAQARNSSSMRGNPVELTANELTEILTVAME